MSDNQETNGRNDTRNVSTTRFVKGGYAFSAPAGTKVPTDLKEKLDPAFSCMGFFSEDGYKENVDASEEKLADANGDTVDTYTDAPKETLAVTLIEMSEEALGIQYGHKNVTRRDGMLVVDHNWGKSDEERAIVLEMVLKNGRRFRKVIEKAKVGERGEVTGNSTTVTGREVTFTYITDDDGSGCKDYIEDIDAPVAEGAGEEAAPKQLDDMTKDELVAYAQERGIDLGDNTLKADILAAIKAAEAVEEGEGDE